jgi:hypothetical protein
MLKGQAMQLLKAQAEQAAAKVDAISPVLNRYMMVAAK